MAAAVAKSVAMSILSIDACPHDDQATVAATDTDLANVSGDAVDVSECPIQQPPVYHPFKGFKLNGSGV